VSNAEEAFLKIRRFLALEIADRIETEWLVDLPKRDGLAICALLVASGLAQIAEPGTKREEAIDAWVKMMRGEIERVQATMDRQRAADIEGCT
jgi:hypothetical protein